jgi:hypothetical protein
MLDMGAFEVQPGEDEKIDPQEERFPIARASSPSSVVSIALEYAGPTMRPKRLLRRNPSMNQPQTKDEDQGDRSVTQKLV